MVLKAQKLAKKYGDIQVLKSVDLEVAPAEMITIVGPSGGRKKYLAPDFGYARFARFRIFGDFR
jgi:lipoprotein-releasing system ATP-binding protein